MSNSNPVRATSEASRVELLEKRISELEAALRPFAEIMAKYKDWPDHSFNKFHASTPLWIVHGTPDKMEFTIFDLRNAARALAGEGEED